MKSYQRGDCPVAESIQPRLCAFKTGMQTLEAVEKQVEALRKAVRYYNG